MVAKKLCSLDSTQRKDVTKDKTWWMMMVVMWMQASKEVIESQIYGVTQKGSPMCIMHLLEHTSVR